MHRIRLILASGFLVLARGLQAQVTSDTTTAQFRTGQWGVGVVQGRALTEAGLLHFSTPTRAWIVDGWAALDHEVVSGAGAFGTDESTNSFDINAIAGPRWYRAQSAHLARFVGFGVAASYARAQAVGSATRDNNWSAGLYGELGLQYMFTRHFGLGWRGIVVGSRLDDRLTDLNGLAGNNTQETTFYRITLEPVQVVATIYF